MMTVSDTGTRKTSHHFYTNQTQPYFRAAHIDVATAARFLPGRRVTTARQAEKVDVRSKYVQDTSDAVLMTSRGEHRYECAFLAAFVRPGIGLGNWVSREVAWKRGTEVSALAGKPIRLRVVMKLA